MSNYNINEQPIVFLRIAWMADYNGVTDDDIPTGAGWYVDENQNGGEVFNFCQKKGKYYGFARIQKNRNINLTKLGAPKGSDELNGVTVVFFSKNPFDGGQWIVGWYKNATLYNGLRQCPKKNKYDLGLCLVNCDVENGKLLNIESRNFEVEGPGQTNLWYPMKYMTTKKIRLLYEIYDY